MYHGLYRLYPGARICESSFDEETRRIGPYIIPLDFYEMNLEKGQSSILPNRIYGELNRSGAMLACVCITTDVLMNVYPSWTEFHNLATQEVQTYQHACIQKRNFEHVGYVQTYQKCIAIYQYPYYLLRDKDTGEIVDFPGVIIKNAQVNPPLKIFRNLADSDANAVWLDINDNIQLLRKEK